MQPWYIFDALQPMNAVQHFFQPCLVVSEYDWLYNLAPMFTLQ